MILIGVHIVLCWVVTPCNAVVGHQPFGGRKIRENTKCRILAGIPSIFCITFNYVNMADAYAIDEKMYGESQGCQWSHCTSAMALFISK